MAISTEAENQHWSSGDGLEDTHLENSEWILGIIGAMKNWPTGGMCHAKDEFKIGCVCMKCSVNIKGI